MQSSLRARRESQASGPETVVIGGRASGKRGWFPDLFRFFGSRPSVQNVPAPDVNPLLAFPSETGPRPEAVPTVEAVKKPALRPSAPGRSKLVRPILIVLLVVALPSLGVLAIRRFPIPLFTASAPRTGTLTIATRPPGSDVLIDGERRGATPLTLALTPGVHSLIIRSGSDERVVPLTIAPGAEVTQYLRDEGRRTGGARRPAVRCDRSAGRARDRRWTAARSLARHCCRSDGGGSTRSV